MHDRFKSKFYIIISFLFVAIMFFSFKINSYASKNVDLTWWNGINGVSPSATKYELVFSFDSDIRLCFRVNHTGSSQGVPTGSGTFYSSEPVTGTAVYYTGINFDNSGYQNITINSTYDNSLGYYVLNFSPSVSFSNNTHVVSGVPLFYTMSDVTDYIVNGVLPPLEYNSSLNLDSLRVTSWNYNLTPLLNANFRYKVSTTWSDSNITNVKVRIKGTRKIDDFLGTTSPYEFKFDGSVYATTNGDVVQIIATPYDANGAYGNSLYSSFTYNSLSPMTYIWRKLFKTPDYDNTIEIPYNDPSGNDNVITVPVDGVTNNYTYNIKYNPQTEEITNQYLVDNYYTLVVEYPGDLSGNETVINETQNYLNEYYTTNNYYQTTKDIDVNFDFDFGDISSNDAQNFKTQFDGFFDGLGSFIGKLAKLLVGLAPWLSPAVAVWIVAGFGFLVALLVLLLVIKLVSFVRSLLPF